MCAVIGKPCHETIQSTLVARCIAVGGGGFAGQPYEQSLVSELEHMGHGVAR
jgi:hypothetical protein